MYPRILIAVDGSATCRRQTTDAYEWLTNRASDGRTKIAISRES
jgi:hypothetical protein